MSINGPILIVEDDTNDADVMAAAIKDLQIKNEIKTFFDGREVVDYLMETTDRPLIILCDIRMPGVDGISLLKHIDQTDYLRLKAIPFVFFTGVVSKAIVCEAYNIGVQGFYQKASSFAGIKEQLYCILVYWMRCLHPNSDGLV